MYNCKWRKKIQKNNNKNIPYYKKNSDEKIFLPTGFYQRLYNIAFILYSSSKIFKPDSTSRALTKYFHLNILGKEKLSHKTAIGIMQTTGIWVVQEGENAKREGGKIALKME